MLCPFHSSTKVLGPVVDLIPRPILLRACLFTSLQNITILSIIVIVRVVHADVKSTNVTCPHYGTYTFVCL